LVQHLASTVPSEKDVDMEEALASFADELPALLARFTNLLQDGIDPAAALRRHPGRIIESV
jgi:hypothetical protein